MFTPVELGGLERGGVRILAVEGGRCPSRAPLGIVSSSDRLRHSSNRRRCGCHNGNLRDFRQHATTFTSVEQSDVIFIVRGSGGSLGSCLGSLIDWSGKETLNNAYVGHGVDVPRDRFWTCFFAFPYITSPPKMTGGARRSAIFSRIKHRHSRRGAKGTLTRSPVLSPPKRCAVRRW